MSYNQRLKIFEDALNYSADEYKYRLIEMEGTNDSQILFNRYCDLKNIDFQKCGYSNPFSGIEQYDIRKKEIVKVGYPVYIAKKIPVVKEISVQVPVEVIKEVEVVKEISVEVISDVDQMKIGLLSEINKNLSNIIFQNDNPKPVPIYYG